MHDWVEKNRCVFRFGCRNVACLELHTLDEQEHKQAKQKLRQREWEAECGFCSVEKCRYGPACVRTVRAAVACDSSYEDEEDGWSVVGVSMGNSFGTELVGKTDAVRLGALGRFGALVETGEEDIPGISVSRLYIHFSISRYLVNTLPRNARETTIRLQCGDGFYTICDGPKFRFEMTSERPQS